MALDVAQGKDPGAKYPNSIDVGTWLDGNVWDLTINRNNNSVIFSYSLVHGTIENTNDNIQDLVDELVNLGMTCK